MCLNRSRCVAHSSANSLKNRRPKLFAIDAVLLFILGVVACTHSSPFNNRNPMTFNQKLHDELISMEAEDQKVLQELVDNGELGTVEYHPRMKAIHEKNNARIKEIINQYGWPGISLVGKEGSKATWLLVQHAVLDTKFMEISLSVLKEAINQGEAEAWCFAYLQDRVLTISGKPQLCGTQHDIDESGIAYPLPIKEPEKVDERRKAMGLDPLSEATKRIQERHNEIKNNRQKDG